MGKAYPTCPSDVERVNVRLTKAGLVRVKLLLTKLERAGYPRSNSKATDNFRFIGLAYDLLEGSMRATLDPLTGVFFSLPFILKLNS
jgi:hypothetical protein